MPEVVVKAGDQIIERVITEKGFLSIGRTGDNDIVLNHRGVSREHARIDFLDDGPLLRDLKSLNGTFVNSKRVEECVLSDEDVITVGKFSLVFYVDSKLARSMSQIDGTLVLQSPELRESLEQTKRSGEEELSETRPIPIQRGDDSESGKEQV
jgi:pSer/pThr/pTyr-binding forkhead associated (FHA) protein